MRSWTRRARTAIGVLLALTMLLGCTANATSTPGSSQSSSPGSSPGSSTARTGTSGSPSTAPRPSGTSPSTSATGSGILHPVRGRLTPQGMWWAVDSTVAVDENSLSNVRHFYRTGHNPVAWGRYVMGHYAIHDAEIDFAGRHHIALYFLVPDANCSGCGGGDACGNDRTAGQARHDADKALAAARRLRLPHGVALFKDLEQVGACYGELSASYVLGWFHRVRRSPYRPAFYGNTTAQTYDFPRAFCAASHRDSSFLAQIVLAQDEPEPEIGAAEGTIGPRTAPPFRPKHPFCTTRAATSIWQYGESISADNLTDVDEIRPGTPGLLAPGGRVTG